MNERSAFDILKRAVDPLALGVGGAATIASGVLTWKQIAAHKALEKAVHKANLTRRLMLAATAASTAGGVAAGYSLGKKQPKKTEKTTVMQPIVVTPGDLSLKAAKDDYSEHRNALRKLVQPVVQKLPGVKKVETEHGSDIVTSSVISDDVATAAK